MNETLEEVRIRKIGVMSFAYVSAIASAIFGLIIGLFLTIFSFTVPSGLEFLGISSYVNYSAIALPLGYGILGFIMGIIGAVFYNIAAKITKGIKIYS